MALLGLAAYQNSGETLSPEEVGHGHVTYAYAILYGDFCIKSSKKFSR